MRAFIEPSAKPWKTMFWNPSFLHIKILLLLHREFEKCTHFTKIPFCGSPVKINMLKLCGTTCTSIISYKFISLPELFVAVPSKKASEFFLIPDKYFAREVMKSAVRTHELVLSKTGKSYRKNRPIAVILQFISMHYFRIQCLFLLFLVLLFTLNKNTDQIE